MKGEGGVGARQVHKKKSVLTHKKRRNAFERKKKPIPLRTNQSRKTKPPAVTSFNLLLFHLIVLLLAAIAMPTYHASSAAILNMWPLLI